MNRLITIEVTNANPATQNFFVFQKPAIYADGATPYVSSLYSAQVATNDTSGDLVTFEANTQFYAGVQQSATKVPEVGATNDFVSAIWPIDLTLETGETNNTTFMSVNPLALTKPTYTSGAESGAFRIVTPEYNSMTPFYFAGVALIMPNDTIILSSYVLAGPSQNIDVQPSLTFYVQTGEYAAGQEIDFAQYSINAALCDATKGSTKFNVTYDSSNQWSVKTQ